MLNLIFIIIDYLKKNINSACLGFSTITAWVTCWKQLILSIHYLIIWINIPIHSFQQLFLSVLLIT
jgi:hypothetical protein